MIPSFGQEERRDESPGEAEVRLAEWLAMLAGLAGVRFYPFEKEALAKAIGPFIRKWPQLKEWGSNVE